MELTQFSLPRSHYALPKSLRLFIESSEQGQLLSAIFTIFKIYSDTHYSLMNKGQPHPHKTSILKVLVMKLHEIAIRKNGGFLYLK